MPGAFVHLELHTDDTHGAKAFYQELFGWSYNDVPMGDAIYTMVASPNVPGAGMQHKGLPDAPTMWLPYLTVDDVQHSVARARELGAEVIVEFMEAPGFGAGAILRDPTGATFGIWKSEAPAAVEPAAAPAKASKKPAKTITKPAAPAPAPTPPKASKKPAKPTAPAPAPTPPKASKKVAKPAPAKPAPAKPGPAKPGPAKPAAAKPAPAKPAPAKPAPAKPVAAKPVPAKPVPAKPGKKPVKAEPPAPAKKQTKKKAKPRAKA
jgi:predicted enzyme related to lactoylglutathione lyase